MKITYGILTAVGPRKAILGENFTKGERKKRHFPNLTSIGIYGAV